MQPVSDASPGTAPLASTAAPMSESVLHLGLTPGNRKNDAEFNPTPFGQRIFVPQPIQFSVYE